MNWSTIIVAVISGISTGFLTALVTPWAQWAVDVRRDRRQNRREFINEWREAIDGLDDVRCLANSTTFPSLIRCLSPSSQQMLNRLIVKYDEAWKQVQENELPRFKQKAQEVVTEEQTTVERNSYFPAPSTSSVSFLRSQYVRNSLTPIRKELSKPLRSFLLNQLAELEAKWRLL